MKLYCVGIDHDDATLASRERLAFSREELDSTLARFASERRQTGSMADEIAILSTCNRVEAYGYFDSTSGGLEDLRSAETQLESILSRDRWASVSESEPAFARRSGISVAIHLARVATGLESMVLGEPQILGQVSAALAAARRVESGGPVLDALFQSAIRAGRRARTETAINRKPATVASVAAAYVRRLRPDRGRLRVAILGAGSVAKNLVRQFSTGDYAQVVILNRTPSGAERLARELNTTAHPLEDLEVVLASTDVLITSTSAAKPIVSAGTVRVALAAEKNRTLHILDLAVPRNVAADVRSLPGTRFVDLDDLRSEVGSVAEERRLSIPLVEQIIEIEISHFVSWYRTRSVEPLISELRRKAESIRQREIARTLSRIPEVDEITRSQVEHLSRVLINKILHDPTTHLREEAAEGVRETGAQTIRQLFNLSSP